MKSLATWKISGKISQKSYIIINNTTVGEKEEIDKNLNKYFTNNGQDIASEIPNE